MREGTSDLLKSMSSKGRISVKYEVEKNKLSATVVLQEGMTGSVSTMGTYHQCKGIPNILFA